ncbi:unnamed protein product [Echinostoma caproni]|uniref:Venom peptide n=1 Tax=Echinostoma caproni TaxID=27848 RepID=A0A183A5L8_9TREM|nr:unnamed protein product [Echinostoma caproni]
MKNFLSVCVLIMMTLATSSVSIPHRYELSDWLSPVAEAYPIEASPDEEDAVDRLIHTWKARSNEEEQFQPIRRLERRRFSRPHGR